MSHFERRKAELAAQRKSKPQRQQVSKVITKAICIESALPHTCVSSWMKADHRLWNWAKKRGWLEECCAHMGPQAGRLPKGHWNILGNVIAEAMKYVTRSDWQEHSPASYNAAHRNGWMDMPEVTGHMPEPADVDARVRGYWQDPANWPQLLDSARKYSSQVEWRIAEQAFYSAARKIGGTFWEACVAHCDGSHNASQDVVYVWAVLEQGKRTGVYKGGRTSSEYGDQRIRTCARRNDMEYEIVAMIQTAPGEALALESEILAMGEVVDMPSWMNGHTEFRKFGATALSYIQQLTADKAA